MVSFCTIVLPFFIVTSFELATTCKPLSKKAGALLDIPASLQGGR
jgi:hypothetical protein